MRGFADDQVHAGEHALRTELACPRTLSAAQPLSLRVRGGVCKRTPTQSHEVRNTKLSVLALEKS